MGSRLSCEKGAGRVCIGRVVCGAGGGSIGGTGDGSVIVALFALRRDLIGFEYKCEKVQVLLLVVRRVVKWWRGWCRVLEILGCVEAFPAM